MKRCFPTHWIIAFGWLSVTAQLSAQEDRIAPPPADRWGFRIGVSVIEPLPSSLVPAGVTFTKPRQQFYAGVLLNPFQAEATSPFFGAGLSYQYYLPTMYKYFTPYVYGSIQGGRLNVDSWVSFFFLSDSSFVDGVVHNSSTIVSGLAGIGFETRLGDHCYGSLSAGGGVYYRQRTIEGEFTEPTDQMPPKREEHTFTGFAAEVTIAFGYRF